MGKRSREDQDTLPPTPRDDRRMRLRREVLRKLDVTELKVVVGGGPGTCPWTVVTEVPDK